MVVYVIHLYCIYQWLFIVLRIEPEAKHKCVVSTTFVFSSWCLISKLLTKRTQKIDRLQYESPLKLKHKFNVNVINNSLFIYLNEFPTSDTRRNMQTVFLAHQSNLDSMEVNCMVRCWSILPERSINQRKTDRLCIEKKDRGSEKEVAKQSDKHSQARWASWEMKKMKKQIS